MAKAIYDNEDDIPETINYKELFTQKDGKWECTGIDGMKTAADIARVQTSLDKERSLHASTKSKLQVWGDMDHSEITARLDRMGELEVAADGKLDEAQLDEMANKRANGIVNTKVAPLSREIDQLKAANSELMEVNGKLSAARDARKRDDILEPLMNEHKVLPEHRADVRMYAREHLHMNDDGEFFSREGLSEGIGAGLTPKDWLNEMLDKRPRWMPGTVGGGAGGSNRKMYAGFTDGKNPWSSEGWNLTAQSRYIKEHGQDKAKVAARSAGAQWGSMDAPSRK